ncbi:MAG: hypothetical protein NTV81_02305 [Candidatus Komeilibacteria bacterium]|nr:hypothetical protein [Candidatus Komeilibacteria bacterium]
MLDKKKKDKLIAQFKKKVNLRKKLLRYLEKENLASFEKLVAKLKIKISRRKDLLELEEEILPAAEEAEEEDKK